MEDLVFRPMAQSDRLQLEAFYRGLGEKSASFFNVNGGNERRTMDFFGDAPRANHEYYVAETCGTVAGHLFIWDVNRRVPWLGIAVRDDFQGRGIGGFMLTSLFALLEARGYGGVLLRTARENVPAQRLYEKYGFERLGTHDSGEYLYIKRFAGADE